jgi:hypothetical protein
MQSRLDARVPDPALSATALYDMVAELPALVAQAYAQADSVLRAQLLECLLQPFGPLALASVASGAFGQFLPRQGWPRLSVSPDDVAQFSLGQVQELACFAFQIDPGVMAQLDRLLSERPVGLPSPAQAPQGGEPYGLAVLQGVPTIQ